MTDYDTGPLAKLGKRRRANRTEAAEIRAAIEPLIREAAAAGVIQARIAELSGMTREAVAQICRPPEERWKRPVPAKKATTKRSTRHARE